ncbi:dihydrofolate reductase family protein [Glycomyces albidus]|uniref:Deaminase n=1 Tax=Glycomyces albidus TaxID=2656774 RepID=A0A6L5G3C3_9ACTN|nr:dihydrofolate reductase family protein [Glycomyces albidus]MQM24125.1 deaminase [Glycomyces albidus]
MASETERPRVVVSVTTSVDGRLTLGGDRRLIEPANADAWQSMLPESAQRLEALRAERLRDRYGHYATLEGSGSLVADAAASPFGPGHESKPDLLADHLPPELVGREGHESWFAVVDGRGRVRWTMKRVGGADLLVLTARAAPAAYLSFLRAEGIPYLVAGEERVDLGAALRRMRERLGVACVVATGGGRLGGALLRAGLVDEVELLVAPAAIGGTGVPSLFDGPELAEGDAPVRLRLMSADAEDDGMLWLRYEVAGQT